MESKGINKHFLLLHFIVFIWGFSPILGKFITANAFVIIGYRLAITVTVMYLYLLITKQNLTCSKNTLLKLASVGLIILVHWLSFYGAIKVSNVSVTMAAFSTGTLFSAIIEPIVFKRKIRLYEIVIGLIIIVAILLIFSVEGKYWLGAGLGVFAALTSSLFGVINGVLVKEIKPAVLSFYELFFALIGLLIYFAFTNSITINQFNIDTNSWIGILLLSLVCTVYPFIASVNLSKYLSPYTILLTVNLETVYGIIWAIIFFNENKDVKSTFYIGVIIILFAVFLNAFIKKQSQKKLLVT
ncbi:MAG: DMT family transporter [Bacteroidetes bacterium]|nr:DMT family transporter [Bacteroidota bacterium]